MKNESDSLTINTYWSIGFIILIFSLVIYFFSVTMKKMTKLTPDLTVDTIYHVKYEDREEFKRIYDGCAENIDGRNIVVVHRCSKEAYDVLGEKLYVLRDPNTQRYYCLSDDVNETLLCKDRFVKLIYDNIK